MTRSDEYERKKRAIAEDFRKNLSRGSTFALDKKTSNLFRAPKQGPSQKLDVKQFNRVLSVDPINRIAVVEAMTTYEDLVAETLKYNCLPPVVPELKTITIGGALVGLGIEASSFRYGLAHETILEVEVLTGDGAIVACSPENEHKDLFFALPNSYGTLGYALKIKLKLIPAKKFVRLTNIRFHNIELYFEKLQQFCLKNRSLEADTYIDGVIFSPDEMYIALGEFVDEAPYASNYTYMNVYFQSIRKKTTDYLTTCDYIWRWDSDWFWCSKHFGMHYKILRLLFGKWMLRSAVYWKIMRLAASNLLLKSLVKLFTKPSESVIQDILIPIQNAPQFFDFFHRSIGISPIWICPFQSYTEKRYSLFPIDPAPLYIDFGFWDIVPSDKPKGTFNKQIEKKAVDLDGYKSLYSDSFYSEEDFWRIHSKSAFAQLKAKYDPKKAFKNLYEKCVQRSSG